jgi:metal-responsive CopG/Arc/MetJ family transcriptional regulator
MKPKRATKNHDRAGGMSQTTLALPQDLLEQLTDAAAKDYRSRNSLIVKLLRKAVVEFQLKA